MGSWLSGRQPLRPSDDLCGCVVLNANWLIRRWHKGDRLVQLRFSGVQSGLLEFTKLSREGTIGSVHLSIIRSDGAEGPTSQTVSLQAQPGNFGGLRWYFVCPATAQRRVKLYLPVGGRRFASRQAYDLVYQVGRENGLDRAHRRLGYLFAKLGLEYDGPESVFPRRPKGMHRKTFEQIEHQIALAEERLESAFQLGLSRIRARAL